MNKKLMTPLFIAASFLLVGCSSDTIVARPTWQSDNIIEGSKDLKDNKMKAIYDAIKNLGDTNANVLSRVMKDIAIKQIGEFKDLRTIGSTDDSNIETIKTLVQTEAFKKFVKEHNIYKADTEGGLRESVTSNNTKSVKLDEVQQGITSFYKIKQQYESMVEDIYEKLYNDIKGGSYSTSDTKLFQEEYYYDYLIKELYEVNIPETGFTPAKNKVFMPKAKGKTWKEYVNIHLDNDGNEVGFLHVIKENNDTYGIYDDYIDRKILPEIYKNCLTQVYVKEQRFSSLGRSYARKVNMVSITTDTTNYLAVPKMLEYFAKNYIVDETKIQSYDFEHISQAMIGFGEDKIASVLLGHDQSESEDRFERLNISINGTSTNDFYYVPQTNADGTDALNEGAAAGTPCRVYVGTKLGELVKKIATCCDLSIDGSNNLSYSPKLHMNADEQKVYDELTSNTHNIYKGVRLKEREIRQTDYTKDGWFLKNGGLTDISTNIRDRLFNITTSTQIDDYARKSDKSKAETKDYIKYFGATSSTSISDNNKRKAFLTSNTKSTTSDAARIVLNETSNSNYYIIEVEEAVNTSKMSSASNSYSYIRSKAENTYNNLNDAYKSTVAFDKIANELVKNTSTNDTYKKNANEYYLMISNIVFYDQSVYDYFKSQFPDLFK